MNRRSFLKNIVKGAGIALCVPVAIDALRPESITEGNLITGREYFEKNWIKRHPSGHVPRNYSARGIRGPFPIQEECGINDENLKNFIAFQKEMEKQMRYAVGVHPKYLGK